MDEATTIAQGGEPEWEETFKHPVHGDLTFKVRHLPTTSQWLQVSTLQERLAPGVTTGDGAFVAEAVAGISTLMELPVITETREQDPENPERELIVKEFYDPSTDLRPEWVAVVWAAFRVWRDQLLSEDMVEQIKNSSGAASTPQSEAVAPSAATTESPRLERQLVS